MWWSWYYFDFEGNQQVTADSRVASARSLEDPVLLSLFPPLFLSLIPVSDHFRYYPYSICPIQEQMAESVKLAYIVRHRAI